MREVANNGNSAFRKVSFSQGRGLVKTYFAESDQNHDFQASRKKTFVFQESWKVILSSSLLTDPGNDEKL